MEDEWHSVTKEYLEVSQVRLPLEHNMKSGAADHDTAEMCPLALKQN